MGILLMTARRFFTSLSTALLMLATAPSAKADWGVTWDELVEDAKETLNETVDDTKKKIQDSDAFSKAKKMWDELAISERLKRAFGEDVDEKSALVGRFFDLKRPLPHAKDAKGRQLKPATPHDTVAIIHEFVEKDWDVKVLSRYHSPQVKLLAPYFYLPRCKASYAPEAFQCDEDKDAQKKPVKPCCWVVLYQGVVTAPASGKFRFVGMCDDAMLVRFNHKLALEWGWSIPTKNHMTLGTTPSYQREITLREKDPAALYQYEETPHWNKHLGGLASGPVFEVEKGEKYPIEILLSEIPGTEFGFVLLVEEVKGTPRVGFFQPWESPTLHLFRTNASAPDPDTIREALGDNLVGEGLECPPFKENSLIWKVDTDTEHPGFLEKLFGDAPDKDKKTAMGVKDSPETTPPAPKPSTKDKKDKKGKDKKKKR